MPSLIRMTDAGLSVPDDPIVPFIEGDGTGPDIWRASVRALDAAVDKAYGGRRRIHWKEVLAGEKAHNATGNWLPEETLEAFRTHHVGIKGPLTTPVGGGIRSLNVALRQILDLYVCLRPVRFFEGVPSPVKHPEMTDMVIFRENSEDIYAGIEFQAGTDDAEKFRRLLKDAFPDRFEKVRFGTRKRCEQWQKQLERIGAPRRDVGVMLGMGIKPVTYLATERLVHDAIAYAIREGRRSVTLVHKGNIMKFTEGAFRDWGYQVARDFFGAEHLDGGPWHVIRPGAGGEHVRAINRGSPLDREIVIKDVIADAFLQQILTRPADYDVIATLNLNGDYISDALAACVGGIGIAPGGNINYVTGHAIFEATHGTAPKYAGKDQVNPGSVILSGEMMLRYMGWNEAADLVIRGVQGAIAAGTVTYDFHRLMLADGRQATILKCSEFGEAVVRHMG